MRNPNNVDESYKSNLRQLKEEILENHRFLVNGSQALQDYPYLMELFEMTLSSAIDKSYAAGCEQGAEDEANKEKNL